MVVTDNSYMSFAFATCQFISFSTLQRSVVKLNQEFLLDFSISAKNSRYELHEQKLCKNLKITNKELTICAKGTTYNETLQ